MEQPRKSTPLSESETAQHLEAAWRQVFGGAPARAQLEWLLALIWNENARGRAFNNHNWGNLSVSSRSLGSADYWRPPWFEPAEFEAMPEPKRSRLAAIHARMVEGKEPSAFRAYSSHQQGAAAFLRMLRDRFPGILKARSAKALQDAVWKSHYCTSPACENMAPTYASLHQTIRERGYFQHLPSGNGRFFFGLLAPPRLGGCCGGV